jgi:DNA-directed RNA polymerase subunit RPC12/RpoP
MKTAYIQQRCPVCGRLVRIEKRLESTPVVCQHCGGNFRAKNQVEYPSISAIHPVRQRKKIEDLLRQSSHALRLGNLSHC